MRIRQITWRAIEEDSTRWSEVKALKELWIHEGEKHHLLEGINVMVQASNLVKAHRRVHL